MHERPTFAVGIDLHHSVICPVLKVASKNPRSVKGCFERGLHGKTAKPLARRPEPPARAVTEWCS